MVVYKERTNKITIKNTLKLNKTKIRNKTYKLIKITLNVA